MNEKIKELFDELLESRGVKDEWYRRSKESLGEEFDKIWNDYPGYWIEEGFVWGNKNDSTIPEGRSAEEDSLMWIVLNRLWQDIYRSQK